MKTSKVTFQHLSKVCRSEK